MEQTNNIITAIQEKPGTSHVSAAPVPQDRTQPKKRARAFFALIIFIALVVGFFGAFLYDAYGHAFFLSRGWLAASVTNGVEKLQPITVVQNDAVVSAAAKVSPAVVSIISHSDNAKTNFFGQTLGSTASGSGFIITSDGLIATNKHVIDGADKITVVTQDGGSFEAKLVSSDPLNDFAIVKVDKKDLPVVDLGYSDELKVGEPVIAIGNALGSYTNSVTAGVISGTDRNIVAQAESSSSSLDDLLQVDAAINQGNSGGPLVNIQGQVIGINTAVDKAGEGIGFAIPINDLRPAIESVIAQGKIVRPMLGVRYVNITPEIAGLNKLPVTSGALLESESGAVPAVIPDGPADKAGLKKGDIIEAVNGQAVSQQQSLTRLLQKFKPGDTVEIKYLRDGKEATVKATLKEASIS
jgi:S1-C subfamily serine protease